MFKKAKWFRPHVIGWGISPRSWQGWMYAIAWAILFLVPVLTIVIGKVLFWGIFFLTAFLIALVMDVKSILDEINSTRSSDGQTSETNTRSCRAVKTRPAFFAIIHQNAKDIR